VLGLVFAACIRLNMHVKRYFKKEEKILPREAALSIVHPTQ